MVTKPSIRKSSGASVRVSAAAMAAKAGCDAKLKSNPSARSVTEPPDRLPSINRTSPLDSDGDGAGDLFRREHPPVRVPCQVEPETLDALRMTPSGNTPQSSVDLVFHFRDLERLALVDATTGEALIRTRNLST